MEKIGQKVKASHYENVEELLADIVLMFDNACRYNEPDSQIYKVFNINFVTQNLLKPFKSCRTLSLYNESHCKPRFSYAKTKAWYLMYALLFKSYLLHCLPLCTTIKMKKEDVILIRWPSYLNTTKLTGKSKN